MSKSARAIVVQKFGGAVLATTALRSQAAGRVLERVARPESVVVVVSAMGRGDEPYSTDALRDLLPAPRSTRDLASLDLLMSCGEVISSVVFAQTLRQFGVDAIPVPPTRVGIVTTPTFGSARIVRTDVSYLLSLLRVGLTPVVPGFIGLSHSGETTTLGRGGSDITAAAIAAELRAAVLELYKDVGAVHDFDPRVEPKASVLLAVSYEQIAHIVSRAERPVIHNDAIKIAKQARLQIVVRGVGGETSTVIT